MSPAFWDASSLVPLCVQQKSSTELRELFRRYAIVVWWATPVEMSSAFERLLRLGELTRDQYSEANLDLSQLRHSWTEVEFTGALRAQAELLLSLHPLKAADALQLAAAVTWSANQPQAHTFISADIQLRSAARQIGFNVVAA